MDETSKIMNELFANWQMYVALLKW
jgi:hypothetical protein